MRRTQRMEQIQVLTRELSALLKEEAPRPAVKFLSAADIPAWVVEGLREGNPPQMRGGKPDDTLTRPD